MASTLVVDQHATFARVLLLSSQRKTKYGSEGEVATSAAGVPQWTAEVAVSYRVAPGQRPQSEVLNVTVTSSVADPFAGVDEGDPVVFDQLKAGLSAPERGEGDRIRGGRLWWQATGVQSALNGHKPSPVPAAKDA